jgi:acetoacetate decarboxylase
VLVVGLVKTPQEVVCATALLSAPSFFNGRVLVVSYAADRELIERLIPPPLVPGDRSRLTVSVGGWESNCVGSFTGGSVMVSVRHGDEAGDYPVAMWMNSWPSIMFGRDVFGEPKKLCTSEIFRHGDRARGWVERHGSRLLDLDAELQEEQQLGEVSGVVFNVKAQMSAAGTGLAGDATITKMTFTTTLRVHRAASATVVIEPSRHDPLDELGLGEPRGTRYIEGEQVARCEEVGTIPAADFLPYYLGRADDWTALD